MLKHLATSAALTSLAGCATMGPEYEAAATVNASVNGQIAYVSDEAQYGVADRWVVNPSSGKGDCEDYALTKVARLGAKGIHATVQMCQTRSGPHAVAVVAVSDTDYVLDNRLQWPTTKADSGCLYWYPVWASYLKTVHNGK